MTENPLYASYVRAYAEALRMAQAWRRNTVSNAVYRYYWTPALANKLFWNWMEVARFWRIRLMAIRRAEQ